LKQIPRRIWRIRDVIPSALLLGLSLLTALVIQVRADNEPSRSVKDGVYAEPQARRGQAVYLEECSRCHSEGLSGGESSPALAGDAFLEKWNGKTVDELFEVIRTTMPADSPGRLSRQQYVDIVAYMFEVNKFPAGKGELERDSAHLKDIVINAKR
jgi:mono/diheme cytochrome c family protein